MGRRSRGAGGSAVARAGRAANALARSPAAATRPWRRRSSPGPPDADSSSSSRRTRTRGRERLRALGAQLHGLRAPGGRRRRPDLPAPSRGARDRRRPVHLPGQPQRLRRRGRRDARPRDGRRGRAAGRAARIDRVFVQVGGGAFASSVIAGFRNALAAAIDVPLPRFDTVQTRGAFPLARAYERVATRVATGETPTRHSPTQPATGRRSCGPGRSAPHSIAHGILDDETYDWGCRRRGCSRRAEGHSWGRALLEANAPRPGGDRDRCRPHRIVRPRRVDRAGRRGALDPDETVAVIFSGVRRAAPEPEAARHRGPPQPHPAHGGT